MKPELQRVLRLLAKKRAAAKLYEEIEAEVAALKNEFGAGRFDYTLDTAEIPEGLELQTPFLKFVITDNLERIADGETVWSRTAFKPLTFEVRGLKTKPKSL